MTQEITAVDPDTASVAHRGRAKDHTQFSFFDADDMGELSDIMAAPDYPVSIIEQFDLTPLAVGHATKLLFCHEGDEGMSLALVSFAPDFILVRHSHDADCLYYVLSGEARLGNRVVGAGSGFYVPAGHTYGYRAGPEGVEILEIRSSTSFGMTVVEENPARWQEMVDLADERQAEWAAFSADAGS
jgi:quercetin dioxygenase-like cupin family protein